MVVTRSKRAKRILRSLSAAQHEDQSLSFSTTPLIRYNLLHNYHRCIQVTVDIQESCTNSLFSLTFDALAHFLRSQLQAQSIADGSRLWSQVAPVLTFIQANLRTLGRSDGFPTLFVWHCRDNHRSYFFFAFVDIKMASRAYTARDLLRMKNISATKDFYDRLYQKLRHDASLGRSSAADWLACILRELTAEQGEIFRLPSDRSLPLIREEEIDGGGNLRSFAIDKASPQDAAARQLDGTDSEWKYRGRSESEEDLSHPLCGPPGLVAQKDKGFQRFYKAVVSPTHVRVTAGGRIVPNTRGSISPTARWAKEKVAGDGTFASRPLSREQPERGPFPIPQSPFGAFPALMPGLPFGVSATMPGTHAFPMVPWGMGMTSSNAFGVLHPHVTQMAGFSSGAKDAASSLQSEKFGELGNNEEPQAFRVPHPEHFDHSRPYLLNGQWVMPSSTAVYPFPVPPFAGLSLPMAGHAMMHPRYGMHPLMMPYHSVRPDHPAHSAHSQASNSTSIPTFVSPANPLPSSILRSEVTKRQLATLRQHLKQSEDQLLYNKHQIDEKSVEQHIQVLRHQIDVFEQNLKAQLSFEGSQSFQANTKESGSSKSSQDDVPYKSSIASDSKPEQATSVTTMSVDDPRSQPVTTQQKDSGTAPSQPLPDPKSLQVVPSKGAVQKPRSFEPVKKPSPLPSTAAMAAPFQPRAEGLATVTQARDAQPRSADPNMNSSSDLKPANASDDNVERPYLIGTVRHTSNFSNSRGVDYAYDRELTLDELRARQMYWGNVPGSIRDGYPRFDGKDFFPPQSARGKHQEPEAAQPSTHVRSEQSSSESTQSNYCLAKGKADSDSFGSSCRVSVKRLNRSAWTQSEHLPRFEPSLSPSPCASKEPLAKSAAPGGRSYEDFRQALGEARPPQLNGTKDKSSSDSGDETNILFKGRKQHSTIR